mmetsp:Transcript_29320/g.53220  ORF Transcript_29320/g.53220 Transcript_29320/m.53220 type:complete len:106 (+) Transcript_29320:174-491(+)
MKHYETTTTTTTTTTTLAPCTLDILNSWSTCPAFTGDPTTTAGCDSFKALTACQKGPCWETANAQVKSLGGTALNVATDDDSMKSACEGVTQALSAANLSCVLSC